MLLIEELDLKSTDAVYHIFLPIADIDAVLIVNFMICIPFICL